MAQEFKDELKTAMMESIRAAGMAGDDNAIEVTVSERDVCVGDLSSAVEVFITGTAAEIVPVQSVATSETPAEELEVGEVEESFSVKFPHGESVAGPVTARLLEMLREVLAERRTSDATDGWLRDVYASPEEFRNGRCCEK